MKQRLVDEFGVEEEKITVVPIFAQRTIHNSQRTTHDKEFIFLTIGRLVEIKNIEMQIRTLAVVVKQFPQVKLLIVGDGKESKKLELRSKKLGIGNNVKFLGWQNNLEKFYEQADTFLLTSNYEGWGMVAIEAASYGLPIIMTDVGCAGEVIKNGESGIVIPVGDQEALEKAMIKLAGDAELRKKLGDGAMEAVKKLPTKEETLKLYLESWRKACKKF